MKKEQIIEKKSGFILVTDRQTDRQTDTHPHTHNKTYHCFLQWPFFSSRVDRLYVLCRLIIIGRVLNLLIIRFKMASREGSVCNGDNALISPLVSAIDNI